MEKKKLIKSLENLSPELKELLKEKYPLGYRNNLIRLTNAKNESFFVVPLDADEFTYMVKVPVEKPKKKSEEDDIELFKNTEDEEDEETTNGESEEGANDPSYEQNFDDI